MRKEEWAWQTAEEGTVIHVKWRMGHDWITHWDIYSENKLLAVGHWQPLTGILSCGLIVQTVVKPSLPERLICTVEKWCVTIKTLLRGAEPTFICAAGRTGSHSCCSLHCAREHLTFTVTIHIDFFLTSQYLRHSSIETCSKRSPPVLLLMKMLVTLSLTHSLINQLYHGANLKSNWHQMLWSLKKAQQDCPRLRWWQ